MATNYVRLGLEMAAVVVAVVAVVVSYHSGAQAERSAMRDDLMATLSVSESVSRYITEMGGYGSVENGRRLMDYRSISSGHDRITPSLKLADGAEAQPGALRINSTMVSTLIELIREFDEIQSEKLRRQIIGPIKNLGKSGDPTLAGAALAILAETQDVHSDRGSFRGAFLQFMLLQNLKLGDFDLDGADLRLASINESDFAACKVAGALFQRAIFQDTTFEIESCNHSFPLQLERVMIGGNRFGVQVVPKSGRVDSSKSMQVDLSGAKAISDKIPAFWCNGSARSQLHLSVALDAESSLPYSIFQDCHLTKLEVPAGASFAHSRFSTGSATGAIFGEQTLLGASFSDFDLRLSDLSNAGLEYGPDKIPFERVSLSDAVVPFVPATDEELKENGIRLIPEPRHPTLFFRVRDIMQNDETISLEDGRAVWFADTDGSLKGAVARTGNDVLWLNADAAKQFLPSCSEEAKEANLLRHPCIRWAETAPVPSP